MVSLSLARIGQATGRLTAIMLAVSGLVVLAAGCLAAGMIRAMLRPLDRTDAPGRGRRRRPTVVWRATGKSARHGPDQVAPALAPR